MAIKVAFIGCGQIASFHVEAVRENNHLGTVVGGADLSQGARDAFLKETGVPVFEDYRKLLDHVKPDAIILSTLANCRAPIVDECVQRKISVLMEKPLAHTVEHGQRLVELADSDDVVCAVGFCHRFASGPRKIKELIANGTLGDLIEIREVFAGHSPQNATSWRSDIAISGGGCLQDNGTHLLDIFSFLAGSISRVTGTVRRAWGNDRGDDTAFLLARSESGVVLHGTSSWMHPHTETSIRVVGTKASACYNYMERDKLNVQDARGERVEAVEPERRFIKQMDAFLRAVRGDHSGGDLGTVEQGLVILKYIDQVYRKG